MAEQRIIFVDWHGVLATQHFWWQVTGLEAAVLRQHAGRIFADSARVADWMRGRLSDDEVLAPLETDEAFAVDRGFVRRTLDESVTIMTLNPELVETFQLLRPHSSVVIATDNMPCFTRALSLRDDLRELFDGVIASTEVGVLKADDPEAFFGAELRRCGARFSDAVLIDDNQRNCTAFDAAGGRSIQFTGDVSAVQSQLGMARALAQAPGPPRPSAVRASTGSRGGGEMGPWTRSRSGRRPSSG